MKKILVIDDEENVTKILKTSLERTGAFEVRTENKGENGYAAAKAFKPDLILLDIMMPGVDGGEIAHQIRNDETIKNTPVLFLTAAVTKEELGEQGSTIAGYPFIAKPISVEDLIRAIKRYAK